MSETDAKLPTMEPPESRLAHQETRSMSSFKFCVGLFLITASTLMLQLVQTRILSVVSWYHLAFFAISMAMFGMTAGAVWVYFRRERFTQRTLSYDLAHYSMAFAVSICLSLIVQTTMVPIVVRSLTAICTWAELAICIAVPFCFSGVVVSSRFDPQPISSWAGVWSRFAGRCIGMSGRPASIEHYRWAIRATLDCNNRCSWRPILLDFGRGDRPQSAVII